jgi:oxygen-independent coproporphyrinogen-3 oxidase
MMTSLRRIEGFDLGFIEQKFGSSYLEHTKCTLEALKSKDYFQQIENNIALKNSAKFLADGIASDFFILETAL